MHLAIVVSRWGEPTQTFVRREAEAARRAGHDVIALSLKAPAPTDEAIPVLHLHGWRLGGNLALAILRHPYRAVRSLGRAVRRSALGNVPATAVSWAIGTALTRAAPRVDWIHAHFAWVAASAADAFAEARRQPMSVFAHAHDIFETRLADGYTADKLRRAVFVLVESERIQDEVTRRFGVPASVQRMGVPPELVADRVPAQRGTTIMSIGSLVPKKGHDDLIRAVGAIEGTKLEIIGEGRERPALTELAASLGCGERVTFRGSVSEHDDPNLLREAVLFCLASKPEPGGDRDGLPNVLIEAMARGVPVVSTRVSGIPDLLGDGRGLLVDPGDVGALTSALRSCLRDPVASRARAQVALDHIRECYTTDRNWELLEERIRSSLDAT